MIDLDERLHSASSAVRSHITKIPMRPPTAVLRRHRLARAASVALGVVVLIAFTGVRVLMTDGSELASDPAPEPAHTYTLDLPSWELAGLWETPDGSGTSHTLFDRIVDGAPRRVTIESGSAAATNRVATLEGLQIMPTTRISLGGGEAIVYDTRELYEDEDQAALLAWSTAVVTWTGPGDQHLVFLFEGVDLNEASSLLVAHLKPVSPDEWQAMTTSYTPPVTIANADLPEQALMSIAVPIGQDDIYAEDLKDVMAVAEADQLFAVPVAEHQVLVRLREGSRPHLYATSCDVLAQVDLPDGWEGTCLERTIDGQRVIGVFEYEDVSE